MRVVSGAALFCVIWTYSSHWPAALQAPPPDHDSRATRDRGAPEPCEAPAPPKKADPKSAFIGVCRDN